MTGEDHHQLGTLLKQFLLFPKSAFFPFYKRCNSLALQRLLYLRAHGWRLPTGNLDSLESVQELACDTIQLMFISPNKEPFGPIYEYFTSVGVHDPTEVLESELERLFLPFFYRHIRQGLVKVGRERNRQWHNTRRRFNDILKEPEYRTVSDTPDSITRSDLIELREDLKEVTQELAYEIAIVSLQQSSTDTKACRLFFDELSKHSGYRRYLSQRLLVTSFVKAREAFVNDSVSLISGIPSPEEYAQMQNIIREGEAAIAGLESWANSFNSQNGKLDQSELHTIISACRLFVEDIFAGTGNDSLAQYFREVATTEQMSQYETRYKYHYLKFVDRLKNDLKKVLES